MPRCFPLLALFMVLAGCQPRNPDTPSSSTTAPIPLSASLIAAFEKDSIEAKAAADSGQIETAIRIFEYSLRMADDSLPAPHAKTAQLHHDLGKLYAGIQETRNAIPQFQQAADLRQQLLPSQSTIATELAKSYFSLANMQLYIGLKLPALDNMQRCIELREAIQPKDSNLVVRIAGDYLLAGILNRELGDIENAMRYLEQATTFFEANPSTYAEKLAKAWYETAFTYNSMGQYEKSIMFYKKALTIYPILRDISLEANCLNNLGSAYNNNKDYPSAEAALKRAEQLNKQLLDAAPGDVGLLHARSLILTNLSILHKRTGRFQEAIAESQESLRLAEAAWKTQYHPTVAACFDNLGNALEESGEIQQALGAYQQAISCVVPAFKEPDFLKNPSITAANVSEKPLLLIFLRDKAKALNLLANASPDSSLTYLNSAFNTWLAADTLLLQIRQSCREDGSKFHLAESSTPMYEQALSLAFELWGRTGDARYRDAALALCERNKAAVLLESLNDAQANTAMFQQGNKTLEQLQTLRKDIARQELAVFKAQMADSTATAARVGKDSLFLLKRSVERLERQFEKESPAWFQQKFALAQSPSPQTLQSQLPDDAAMLEYFLGDSTLFTVCLTKRSFQFYQTALPANFWDLADKFHRSVSDWDFVQKKGTEAEAAYLESAVGLYDFLLKKPLDAISKDGIRRLVIVPDGALGYLPFEAMLTSPANGWKQPNLHSLLQQYAVSYAYSAHFLKDKNPDDKGKAFAGFGLSYDDRTLLAATEVQNRNAAKPSAFASLRGSLGKLPHSVKEVEASAKILTGNAWLDADATKANFLQHAPGSGILHFAGHGFTDPQHPLNSALLFTKTTDSTDCLLRAADLYGLRLNASLAVLSACNTGAGELRKGEGIMSFARAFAGAGVPAVVMSLWSVSDASTSNVVQGFYASLKKGEAKDEALRHAKLDYLSSATPERALPIYWAGAVLMGDASPLSSSGGSFSWPMLALFALLGLVVAAVVSKRFMRKN